MTKSQEWMERKAEGELIDMIVPEPTVPIKEASGAALAAPSLSLSVVIPALNEEHGIDEILQRVLAQRDPLIQVGVSDLEVIVVDDGSKDRTAELVSTYGDVRLIQHPTNRGYGAALKTGLNAARGDLLAFLDADGTYPPESFPTLCQTLVERNADLIIGSRMLSRDSEMPLVRRIGNTIFAALLSIVGSRRISDSASGMRVFRRDALATVYPLPNGLDFTPAMSTRAVYEGLAMVEVPIPYKERIGRSKLNPLKDGVRFLRSILWTALLYDPQRFFGTLGLLMLAAALVLGLGPTLYYRAEPSPARGHDLPPVRRAHLERGWHQYSCFRRNLPSDPGTGAGSTAASIRPATTMGWQVSGVRRADGARWYRPDDPCGP